MFNSVALDVVIGLVFIFLLYSLLVTVISELIATSLGLRARNLKEAVDRMLNDEKPASVIKRALGSLNIFNSPKNPVVNAFYNHPEIKYLGNSGVFKTPSYFKAESFSKTLINILFGEGKITKETINQQINKPMIIYKNDKNEEKVIELDKETSDYIRGLWSEAEEDVDEFKKLLESWFDRTMEHTIEWYRRKIRLVTFVLGFLIAWFFNADTFVIVKNLSTDKKAREQMVDVAIAYVNNNQVFIDSMRNNKSPDFEYSEKKLDSLLVIQNQLETDISKANSLLGIGCRLPEKFTVSKDKAGNLSSVPTVDPKYLKKIYDQKIQPGKSQTYSTLCKDQWHYFWWIVYLHFFGFLVTAIAVSLGAPFWFDLLSKVMALRTAKKEAVTVSNAGNSAGDA